MFTKPIVVGRGTASNGQQVVILRIGDDDVLLDVDRAENIASALQNAALDVRRTSGLLKSTTPSN